MKILVVFVGHRTIESFQLLAEVRQLSGCTSAIIIKYTDNYEDKINCNFVWTGTGQKIIPTYFLIEV